MPKQIDMSQISVGVTITRADGTKDHENWDWEDAHDSGYTLNQMVQEYLADGNTRIVIEILPGE